MLLLLIVYNMQLKSSIIYSSSSYMPAFQSMVARTIIFIRYSESSSERRIQLYHLEFQPIPLHCSMSGLKPRGVTTCTGEVIVHRDGNAVVQMSSGQEGPTSSPHTQSVFTACTRVTVLKKK